MYWVFLSTHGHLTDKKQFNSIWEFSVDNIFATKLVNVKTECGSSDVTKPTNCCTKCQRLEFWTPHFSIEDRWEDLEHGLRICPFCKIRWQLCQHLNREEFPTVRFDRDQSTLKLNKEYPPVLSLRRSPGQSILGAAQVSRFTHVLTIECRATDQ